MSLLDADVRVATLTLTQSQIDTLFATPVEIVPAPGAGLIVKPIAVCCRLQRGTVAWSNSRNLQIQWTGNTANLVQAVSILFANGPGATLDQFFAAAAVATLTGTNNVDVSNRALEVTIQTGDISGGNAGDTLKINLLYEIITELYT
jgi:hypothetical protein